MQVEGATIVVTGASSGIGASLAPLLAERGATVGIAGRRADRLAEVLARCQVHAPASRSWVVDLGQPDAAERWVLEARDRLGGIDVLVNNAATPMRRAVQDLTVDDVHVAMRTNFESPVRMALALLPDWLERDQGMVVNVSSLGGRLGIAHEAAYCASKFALCGWSESMAMDLWHTGVEVRLVIPGPIDTDIWDRPGNDEPLFQVDLVPPSIVAEGIVAAIEGDAFEHYLPDLSGLAEFKTANIDQFLAGSAGAIPEDRR